MEVTHKFVESNDRVRAMPECRKSAIVHVDVHAATAWPGDDSKGYHPLYLLNSPLSRAQRAWSNICAPRFVQRICCFFSIRQSTNWSTVDSTRAVDMRWPSRY